MLYNLQDKEDILKARSMISNRIEEILLERDFALSKEYFSYIHEYLFHDIYPFAGTYRNMNIMKREDILDGDSVIYADFNRIVQFLDYDMAEEREKGYRSMSDEILIKRITHFTSNIWQVHPFLNGNTRTVAVFVQKMLRSKGINVGNEIFKNNSAYFRDALVLSNYYDDIYPDFSYLNKFYETAIFGVEHDLSRVRKI